MRVTEETKKTVTLVLSEEEARWLSDVMQNPLGGMTPDEEPFYEREMRKKFWEALPKKRDLYEEISEGFRALEQQRQAEDL